MLHARFSPTASSKEDELSESKAKLHQEAERMRKVVYEAALLLDIVDSMDYDFPGRDEFFNLTASLRKAMYGDSRQQG
jgi:hypothetical protein